MARFAWIAAVGMAPALHWGATAMFSLLASVAHADRVHLVDGAVIEGKVTRQGDRVVIELESGQLGLPADQVARIEPASSPVQQLEERRARLQPRDVAGRLALANYCRDHGMVAREQQLLREVIELAPDHAEARARLGYVQKDRRWVEREQDLRERGLVQHEGRWLTREQVLEIERLRAEAQTAAHQRDKARAELESARAELERRERDASETETAASPQPPPAEPAPSPQQPVYVWSAPYAFRHDHDHDHDRRCPGPRCPSRAARPRTDGRPPWTIVGTRDPFDYLRWGP
jgi:hypothetical protein